MDDQDDVSSFIGGVHRAVHGALGRRAQMSVSPPDGFVRAYFVEVEGAAQLWAWSHADEAMRPII
jgi:hypothetical protein